jgi:amino acid adenylation domain-containing protein
MPAVLPHAEVYGNQGSQHTPPHVTSRQLGALLGPLATGDSPTPDIVLALIIAYIARTSGEPVVGIGYVDTILGKVVPFIVRVDGTAPFARLVRQVAAERRGVNAGRPLNVAAADMGDDEQLAGWTRPPVIVAFDARHTEAVAAASQLGLVIDERSHLARWFSPARISRRFIDSAIGHIAALVQAIAADPERSLASHEYLSADEKNTIVAEWNDTARRYPYEGGLVARFNAQAALFPAHPAVIFAGASVSYGDLKVRIDRLARYLRQQGVSRDTFVGICMERSVEMVIAVYAILEAGGAYVPLSPEDPPQRLAAIIRNAGLRLIITQETLAAALPTSGVHPIVLTADPGRDPEADNDAAFRDVAIAPDDLAYMIYTSGSTGEPKGVLIQHKAIFNRIAWMQETYRLTPADRVLQKTPYTFDVSVWEFLWPLTVGATLIVAEPGGHIVPSYLSRLIRQETVTCCHFVPSVLKLFLACPKIESLPLRLVFCSGEALPFDVQRMFLSRSGAELHNLYGPTEAAVDVSWWHCQPDVHDGRVPIGKPIANIQLYILDKELRPVAAGVPGELYIAGIGLAIGYWQNPQLTAERFVPNPLASVAGERMYKTGDVARFLPDGNIEYLGRNDDQVKINGIRMELGEIESAIRGHPSISDVVVVAKQTDQGTAQLAAYLVTDEEHATDAVLGHIRQHIVQRLPQPMIPRDFAFVPMIPLTRNGKADRKALMQMEARQMEAQQMEARQMEAGA